MGNKNTKSSMVYACTEAKIKRLQDIADTGSGKKLLAELRRGIGKKPGEAPELWGMIFEGMPEELLGNKKPSSAEQAIYTALTLYALHRQGSDNEVNKKDISVGSAASNLVDSEDDVERVMKRLNLVVTADSPDDLSYHLRGLVQLFKSKDLHLDYALLAKDIYLFNVSEYADDVKMRWGRDFYREKNNKSKGEDNNG